MYVVTVIPIQKNPSKEFLTYFSNEKIPLGDIVVVPVRTKNINAIVADIEDLRNIKTEIKGANFELRKIIKTKGGSPFSLDFFNSCELMKDYVISNTGSVIKSLLPSVFLENMEKLKNRTDETKDTALNEQRQNIKSEKLIFQALTPDRLAFYRTLIRESFAKKESVYICVPTHFDIELFKEELTKGIEQYVFTFHSEMSKKSLIENYNKSISEGHPILIIGTGIFLSIPRLDVKTIILENESSGAYKQLRRPFIDIRTFVEIFSSLKKSRLIIGDSILRPETLYRHDSGELGEISSPLFRLPQVEQQIVIDMREEETNNKKTFNLLSSEVLELINKSISGGKSIFLYSIRKGLAPFTVCQDCGNTLLCEHCDTPIVLYGARQSISTKTTTPRIFMCNKCGRKEKTELRCPKCSSWNLLPLGIGSDRIYEEVKNFFPRANIIQIDKETVTDKEAISAINFFYDNPGSILIGTEMVFSFLKKKIDNSVIVSLDGLFSIPSFNITQKILHTIEKLQYITSAKIILQTRQPENQILKYISSGNVLPLYREDLNERKMFNYPPYKRLIKITFSGTKEETEKMRVYLDNYLGIYEPQIFSAFIGRLRGQYITNTVIKVDPNNWRVPIDRGIGNDQILKEKLFGLPPNFLINVDPEDLL